MGAICNHWHIYGGSVTDNQYSGSDKLLLNLELVFLEQ